MSIRDEISALAANGIIKPADVVAWAKAHPASALYTSLEWDNGKAAHEYRLWQVRRLIAVHIVTVEGTRQFLSLSIDRNNGAGGGYREIEAVMRNPDTRAVALADALSELGRTETKYKWLKELSTVWESVRAVKRRARPQTSHRNKARVTTAQAERVAMKVG